MEKLLKKQHEIAPILSITSLRLEPAMRATLKIKAGKSIMICKPDG